MATKKSVLPPKAPQKAASDAGVRKSTSKPIKAAPKAPKQSGRKTFG